MLSGDPNHEPCPSMSQGNPADCRGVGLEDLPALGVFDLITLDTERTTRTSVDGFLGCQTLTNQLLIASPATVVFGGLGKVEEQDTRIAKAIFGRHPSLQANQHFESMNLGDVAGSGKSENCLTSRARSGNCACFEIVVCCGVAL